jgi:hypothetical protein
MEVKKPWQSKTMLLNGIGGLLVFLALFVPGAEGVSAWLNANGATVGMVWAFANMVLRMVTKGKIQLGE